MLRINAMFGWLLRELGYEVTDLVARFWRDEVVLPPMRRHHVLKVKAEGAVYLCDVGVGGVPRDRSLCWRRIWSRSEATSLLLPAGRAVRLVSRRAEEGRMEAGLLVHGGAAVCERLCVRQLLVPVRAGITVPRGSEAGDLYAGRTAYRAPDGRFGSSSNGEVTVLDAGDAGGIRRAFGVIWPFDSRAGCRQRS